MRRAGYEPQRLLLLEGQQARVWASQRAAALPTLHSLELTYDGENWQLLTSGW